MVLIKEVDMAIKRDITVDPVVQCEICLAEIPSSSAKSEEASDYVMYFCGLNCYEKWKNRESATEKTTEPKATHAQPEK